MIIIIQIYKGPPHDPLNYFYQKIDCKVDKNPDDIIVIDRLRLLKIRTSDKMKSKKIISVSVR